ncbi:type II toxin-antitoxin system VapC family toxin [Candidatus Palauibacter sp.]|uniref:type II toxin-antitoxin system VapC family toxin n=1 Tax=Candidatus Palauibacter sp. TaxID=3101350 RepID=UPI003C7004BF
MIVVDTNVMVHLVVGGTDGAAAARLFRRDPEWAPPALLMSELRNVLVGCVREATMTPDQSKAMLDDAASVLGDRLATVSGAQVIDVALECGLTAYDAEFVAIARTLGVRLATLDRKIRGAHRMWRFALRVCPAFRTTSPRSEFVSPRGDARSIQAGLTEVLVSNCIRHLPQPRARWVSYTRVLRNFIELLQKATSILEWNQHAPAVKPCNVLGEINVIGIAIPMADPVDEIHKNLFALCAAVHGLLKATGQDRLLEPKMSLSS